MSMTQTQQNNVPTLRFPEFSGEWVPKTLFELSKNGFSNGVFNDPRKVGSGYKLINVKDMYKGNEISLAELSLLELSQKEFENKKVVWGDVFFTRSSLVKDGIAYSSVFLSNDSNTTYDGHLIRMSPDKKQVTPEYLGYALKTDASRRQLVARGKTTTMTTIGQEDISSVVVVLGGTVEQQKIASFLSSVDGKIEQLGKKKTLLEQHKKGMMQKLFSQELRFKDAQENNFSDWEEKRLGEVVQLIGGLTYSPSDIRSEGLLVLRSSNVQQGKIALGDNVFVNREVDEGKKTKEGDILLCVRNGSQRLIGKSAQIPKGIPTATHGAFMSVLRGAMNDFVFQLMQTPLFFKEVHKNLGATINSINGSDMKKFKFLFPTDQKEQQRIADFLSSIDRKIDLVSTELNYAKSFKKGLLQQMFI